MNTAILTRACADALHHVGAASGGQNRSSPRDPSHTGCRDAWRFQSDGEMAIDYDLSIDLRLQREQAPTSTASAADRCDTASIRLESGLTLCVRRSTNHTLGWDGVLNSRGVDVELRLIIATSHYASDSERFTRNVRPVLEGAATVLADAILGRYVPGVRTPPPSRTGG
jgi:hypothetical protein